MARSYNKKSDYWTKFERQSQPNVVIQNQAESFAQPNFDPALTGEPFYTSDASSMMFAKASREGLTTGIAGSRLTRPACCRILWDFPAP